jgi:3-hydroxybutyrate dehydrogenase
MNTLNTSLFNTTILAGKTVLITGATSGIGLDIAKKFAVHGAKIAFNGFGDIEHAISILKNITPDILYVECDLKNVQAIEAMHANVYNAFGGVDILINNAGIQHVECIEKFPVDKWNDIIAINLSAVFHNIRLYLPYMQQQQWGRIINIASVHGLVASKYKSAYVAAKHGVIGLTKAVGLEQAAMQKNITCNAICPGWVKTPLVEAQIQAKAQEENSTYDIAKQKLLAEKQPSQDFVEAEHIADLALLLCSDTGKQIQGAAWNIDGGWMAQ